MLKSKLVALGVSVVLVGGLEAAATASPALAVYYGNQIAHGNVLNDSTCNSVPSTAYLHLNNPETTTRPLCTADVNFCPGITNGTDLAEALASYRLFGKAVTVVWGNGGEGLVNCDH